MQVWNVLHAENTACKNRQKIAICAPSYNFVELYLCNEGMYRQSEKFLNRSITSTCSHNSELRPISGWDRLVSSRHPSIFQRVSRLGFVTTLTLLNGGQPNFARCLAASCAGRIFIRFEGSLSRNGILPGAKFTLHASLAFSYIANVTVRHLSSRRQPNFAAWYKEWNYGTFASQRVPPILGRTAITFGIGPHSTLYLPVFCCNLYFVTEYAINYIFKAHEWPNANT